MITEAILKINKDAQVNVHGSDLDTCTIEWLDGTAEISKADIKTKMQDIETNGTAKDQKKHLANKN